MCAESQSFVSFMLDGQYKWALIFESAYVDRNEVIARAWNCHKSFGVYVLMTPDNRQQGVKSSKGHRFALWFLLSFFGTIKL